MFRERGFHAVGIDEIGKKVGISGPAVYRHFKSKDEILATLFDEAMDIVMVHPLDTDGDAERELDLLIRNHARFAVEHADLVAVYVREHRALVDPWKRMFNRRIREQARRWESAIGRLFPTAEERDVAIAAQAAIGLLHSVVEWPPKLLKDDTIVDRLHTLVRSGLSSLEPEAQARLAKRAAANAR